MFSVCGIEDSQLLFFHKVLKGFQPKLLPPISNHLLFLSTKYSIQRNIFSYSALITSAQHYQLLNNIMF